MKTVKTNKQATARTIQTKIGKIKLENAFRQVFVQHEYSGVWTSYSVKCVMLLNNERLTGKKSVKHAADLFLALDANATSVVAVVEDGTRFTVTGVAKDFGGHIGLIGREHYADGTIDPGNDRRL